MAAKICKLLILIRIRQAQKYSAYYFYKGKMSLWGIKGRQCW